MNFTNINDPAGVKALLDQLRASQAWKEVLAPSTSTSSASHERHASTTAASTSVASLLSQLQSLPSVPPLIPGNKDSNDTIPPSFQPHEFTPSVVAPISPRVKTDTRSYTFQQALPLIAQLAEDPEFVENIKQIKKEQDDLERQLWEDRRAIHKKYEEKVKVAATKANMIGDRKISKHEADMIQTAFKKELDKFDRERVLLAWDGLVSKQQAILASHSVPTMFVSTEGAARDRQQRVIQVLENIVGS